MDNHSNVSIILMVFIIELFDVYIIYPPKIISSNIPYTLLKLKTMSNSQTFPKYWSKVYTNKWINYRLVM